jgi:DNA polymerase-3 subunit gamma/tau
MLVSSLGNDAKAILRGIGPEQFDILTIQANRFGLSDLTAAAEATSKALSDTSAASNPRLQLELLCARVLAPVSQRSLAAIQQEPVAAAATPVTAPVAPAKAPAAAALAPQEVKLEKTAEHAKPVTEKIALAPEVKITRDEPEAKSVITEPRQPVVPIQDITTATVKAAWPMILETLAKQSRSAWAVAFTTKVIDFKDEVLTLLFQSQNDVDAFKSSQGAAEVLRQVIREQLGVVVKYRAKVAEAPVKPETKNTVEPTAAEEFTTEEEIEAQDAPVEVANASEPEAEQAGEFVLREVLGAKPIKGEAN